MNYFFNRYCYGAVLLMFLNDQIFKHSFPSWVTGKLSDFAGVFFLPFFLCVLCDCITRFVLRKEFRFSARWLIGAMVITDLILVGLKLSPAVVMFYQKLNAAAGVPVKVVMDRSDLLAIFMNFPTFYLGRRYFQ